MSSISTLHLLIAIALSATIVVLPMGYIMMVVPWIIVVAIALKRESKRNRGGITFATYVIVTLIINIMAVLAPVKTMESVLENPLVLPKAELTLCEMDREISFELTQWLPRYSYVATRSESADTQIHFRTTVVTLREFIATIESRSQLRHRFMHCGNGSSILFGGDCCFGLKLR